MRHLPVLERRIPHLRFTLSFLLLTYLGFFSYFALTQPVVLSVEGVVSYCLTHAYIATL